MPLTGFHSLCNLRQRIIVSRDEGQAREHRAQNVDGCRVSHYKIDGTVVRDASKRCDFLLMNDDRSDAYLIELKGTNIEDALEQLEATAQVLQQALHGYRIKYRLVHSKARTHALNGNKFKKFQKRHGSSGEFLHRERVLEESI